MGKKQQENLWWKILDLCPRDIIRDYANEVLDLMDSDTWRELAGEARMSRYDALD